jgi:hypothetical protein
MMLETIRSVIFEAGTDVEETIAQGMLDSPAIVNLLRRITVTGTVVTNSVTDPHTWA